MINLKDLAMKAKDVLNYEYIKDIEIDEQVFLEDRSLIPLIIKEEYIEGFEIVQRELYSINIDMILIYPFSKIYNMINGQEHANSSIYTIECDYLSPSQIDIWSDRIYLMLATEIYKENQKNDLGLIKIHPSFTRLIETYNKIKLFE